MLFNSVEFLIFFPIVVVVYFLLPFRVRWLFLLAASYFFYMSWEPEYIILLIFSTLVGYFTALGMSRTSDDRRRKTIMIVGVIAGLSVLFFFKYFNFFTQSLQSLFNLLNIDIAMPIISVILPIGISFYTFHTLNYIFEVYWRREPVETHAGKLGLFVAFFPLLVAGPIERSQRLLPQISTKHHVDYIRITDGLKLMAWGFFKKLVIADRLAVPVNTVYNDPTAYTGIPLIVATFMFAIQIYCDFSGYTDIAIGAAKVMGFDLMTNFRRPYFSSSISEFWRRWHISLSSWFRDYLYIPLGGNRVKLPRMYFNIMIVFLVSGLWHGASWTFVIWGGLHGLYLVGALVLGSLSAKYLAGKFNPKYTAYFSRLKIPITFGLVLIAWVFFRANSLPDAIYILTHMFSGIELRGGYGLNLGGVYEVGLILASLIILFVVDFMQEKGYSLRNLNTKPLVFRWVVYYALVFSILLFGKLGSTEFIYFQF
jgi:D-alanyl-lipoteichoic acid acyltransferase DltB (MBOAT superfamily)